MMNSESAINSFTIDDIRDIRHANYERTKNMTHTEILEHTHKEAQYGLEVLRDLKNGKIKTSQS